MIGFVLEVAFLTGASAETPRQVIARAIVQEDDAQKITLINSLIGNADPISAIARNALLPGVILSGAKDL